MASSGASSSTSTRPSPTSTSTRASSTLASNAVPHSACASIAVPHSACRVAARGLAGSPVLEEPAPKSLSLQSLGGFGDGNMCPSQPVSGKLAGLAAALGLGPEGRLALLAVTTALEAAGLEEPLDVAFVGNGDTLPPGTITQILEGCDVPGAEDVLKGMFRVAREGMEGSIAIRARGLTRAAARPPREAWVSQSQEGRLGNKAEARVLSALVVPAVTSKRARRAAKTETSLRSRETGQFEGAMNRCFSLLREMGPKSPRCRRAHLRAFW